MVVHSIHVRESSTYSKILACDLNMWHTYFTFVSFRLVIVRTVVRPPKGRSEGKNKKGRRTETDGQFAAAAEGNCVISRVTLSSVPPVFAFPFLNVENSQVVFVYLWCHAHLRQRKRAKISISRSLGPVFFIISALCRASKLLQYELIM